MTTTYGHVNWPSSPYSSAFQTIDGDESFALIEDEDGSRLYSYGHVPEDEMIAEAMRFYRHTNPTGDEPFSGSIEHVYAKPDDPNTERFTWAGVTAETEHAFPLTVLDW